MYYTSRTSEQARAWQADLREELFEILKLSDLVSREIPIPFDSKEAAVEEREGYVLRELEINTTPGRRIQTVGTLPEAHDGPCPAVVCIHGHGGNRHIVYDGESIYKGFAASLAEDGYVTVSTDIGRHGVHEEGRILMGERLWDLMRCVDYLESLPQVDRSRIGCAGLSLGGEMVMWLAAMDERIAAAVTAGFLTLMDQMEQNHCMCWKFDGLRELVDFPDIYSLIAPRALLCQNGLQEPATQFCVPLAKKAMEQVEIIYRDLGQPGNVALDIHEGAHEINLPTLLAFFQQHLGSGAR